jgi:hypothetical protein
MVRLDDLANPLTYTALDRIKPVVKKLDGGVAGIRLVVASILVRSSFRRPSAG